MEDKGKIKIKLGTLLIIILIIIVITAVCTCFIIMKNRNEEEPSNTTQLNTTPRNTTSNKNEISNTTNTTGRDGGETGAFKTMTLEKDGIKIKINSSEPGHPEPDSLFTTFFEIEHDDGSTWEYQVEYTDIVKYEKGIVFDRVPCDTFKINDKSFDCIIEENEYQKHLIYWIPGGEQIACIDITIKGGDVFDKEGNQAKMQARVDEDVLKSKELAGILNFTVEEE